MYSLVKKYISGQLSAEERGELADALASDSNEALTTAMHKVWTEEESDCPPTPAQLVKMKCAIDTETGIQQEATRRFPRWFTRVAAVLLPLFVLSTALLAYLLYNNGTQSSGTLAFSTTTGQQATVTLPDGSVVSLNENTQLSYSPDALKDGKRTVQLNGEAYFKVKHNDKLPFVVATADADVTVLGTEFDVEARSGEPDVSVILDRGKLNVRASKSDNSQILTSGEKAVVNRKTGEMRVSRIEQESYRSDWQNKALVFNNAPLSEVVKVLAKTYPDKKIVWSGKSRYNFNGTLPSDNLNEALRIVNLACETNIKTRNK